jgi:hypothetical protein
LGKILDYCYDGTMPHQFRTEGRSWKAGEPVELTLPDGTIVQAIWAGSAQEEKLEWRLRQPGNELAQTEQVSEIAVKADDNGEMIWGAAPFGARLIFVLEPRLPNKNYRLARMVTTAATPAQVLYFRHGRFSLFGTLKPDGTLAKIPPLTPPPAPPDSPPKQGQLF